MIKVIFKGAGKEFEFPPVTEKNSPCSLTDYGVPGTEIVMIFVDGSIKVSKAGVDMNLGDYKLVDSFDLRIEKQLEVKEVYKRKFTGRFAEGELFITRID